MSMRRVFFSTVLLLLSVPVVSFASGWQAVGNVTAFKQLPDGVEVQAGRVLVRIVALNPSVVRVRYAPDGAFPPEHSFVVLKDTGFTPPIVRVKSVGKAVEFKTSELTLRIERTPLRIVFADANGNVLSQDDPAFPVSFNGAAFRVWKSMPIDEHYYGLGDKAGPIDHRDQSFAMWNTDAYGWTDGTDPVYKSIPFFLAMRKGVAYGIYLDNTYRSSFDFGKEFRDRYSFGSDGGELDYYFFYGPNPKKVIQEFTALTGRMPLPPLFALGYQQCRYSYYPESRVRQLANEFRSRKIPADVIYLDIDYQDGYRPFTINRKYFPNFEGMIHDLGQQGFKVVTIVDLHVKKEAGYKPFDEGLAGDHFVKNPDSSLYVGKVWPGDSVFPDFTRANTREWYGGLYKSFLDMGVRGIWNDMNEPAVFRYPEKTMPLDTVHRIAEGDQDRKTDHREIHNVFGMMNVRATYEGMRRLSPDMRPFVLTRAGFAGTQRWAATWTGDNTSTWSHMRVSVPQLLSLGISGYAFVGDDIGGFDGGPLPDLLTRWMELGAFNPMYRNHTSSTFDQEPWANGPEHEAIRKRYIETRYRLLPYIYTGMEEASRTGVPLMRPMFLEYPQDEKFTIADKQFMFGSDLLVAPKIQETRTPYEVILPQGNWYEFWTGTKVEGGKSYRLDPPLDTLPIYVRGGAIIPEQPVVQNTAEVPQGPLELHVYPGPDCRGSVYADDGETFAYTRGDYLRQSFTCEATPENLRVKIAPTEGAYRPWWKSVAVNIAGVAHEPHAVEVAGTPVTDWAYNNETKSLMIAVPATSAGVAIEITY